MARLYWLLGHGSGIVGAILAVGLIGRMVPLGLLRLTPYAASVTHLKVGGPLSISLIGLGMLLVGGDKGKK